MYPDSQHADRRNSNGHNDIIDYRSLIEDDRIQSSLYSDPAVFRDELERIFYGGWVFIGHDSEITRPGDFVCRTIGLEPVIMLRNADGEIRVHSNRCTHRGNTICSIEKGSAKLLTCDYHGWVFSLNGDLLSVTHPEGFCKDKGQLGLRGPALVSDYKGFVFASFNPNAGPLEQHLGNAMGLIDRAVNMSPVSKLKLTAGWAKQALSANWKMLPENSTDGYHAPYTHASFFKVFRSQLDASTGPEKNRGQVKDLGNGHGELDLTARYKKALDWFGTSEQKMPEYVARMLSSHGEELGRKLLFDGPPHATIFPNLFIAEGNIVIFQPLSPTQSVQWHTPMFLEGVDDDFNGRLLRQSEGALGPSSFLVADDATIFERQNLAAQGRASWMDASRGLNREKREDGVITSAASDEVTVRGFWRHYLKVMEQA